MKVFRSIAIFLMATGLTASLFAQAQSGNIYGRVTDEQGGVLPGVSVTLTGGGAPRTSTTGTQGEFRFLNLSPGTYRVKTELAGFASVDRGNVTVNLGTNTELTIPMKLANVATTITVTSETPLLDSRRSTSGQNFSNETLKEIPTARDPWVILQQVPGVSIDRVNVAGSESGQQSVFVGKGSDSTQNSWQVDGVTLTDMSALGSSTTYYDFDAFQEMQATTGGTDPSLSVPGVTMNLVTKRGTNEVHGSARVFETPSELEAKSPTSVDGHAVRSGNFIDHIQDYGVEAGGPLWPDKAWLWGSYGRQQIDLIKASSAAPDKTTLENYSGKLNIQPVSSNSFTAFYFRGNKIKVGRTALADRGQGTAWNQSGPTTIWKADDSQVFGANLVANLAWSYVATGFQLAPQGGLGPNISQDVNGTWQGTFYLYQTYRPQHQVNGTASAFFNTGSLGHELKFGFGYRKIIGGSSTTWPGDNNIAYYNYAGNGTKIVAIERGSKQTQDLRYMNAFLSDTLTANNLTVNIGVRYDDQKGKNTPTFIGANPTFPTILPGINYAGGTNEAHFKDWQPRVGLTYALGANKSTLLRASYSRFADQLGAGIVAYDNPLRAAYIDYYFTSAGRPTSLADLGAFYSSVGVDPNNPGAATSPNVIQHNLKNVKTDEFTVGFDHQLLPEFVVGATYTYRHRTDIYTQFWKQLSSSNFVLDPAYSNLPAYDTDGNFVGNTGNYYMATGAEADPNTFDFGGILKNIPGAAQNYNGVELQMTKRLSNRWMAHAGFTYNTNKWKISKSACQDPTNSVLNTWSLVGPTCGDGQPVYDESAGSGSKGDVYLYSRWNFNVAGMYQLPLNFNIAANFFGREGYVLPFYATVNDPNDITGPKTVLVGNPDDHKLKNVYELDLRVEKVIPLFQKADLSLSVDLFNALNDHTVLQRRAQLTTNPAGNVGNRASELQSPRVLRFGARLSF